MGYFGGSDGLEPLKPFREVEDMVAKTKGIFDHVDDELAAGFQTMRDQSLLDLANRKGKAPGGIKAAFRKRVCRLFS